MQRNARRYLAFLAITILLGLLSRRFPRILPAAFGKYPGDLLWGLMVFWIWALLLRKKTTLQVGLTAALFSLAIEFFKLFHSLTLDRFRATGAGKLLLGVSFSWLNLASYLLGIVLGMILETKLLHPPAPSNSPVTRSV